MTRRTTTRVEVTSQVETSNNEDPTQVAGRDRLKFGAKNSELRGIGIVITCVEQRVSIALTSKSLRHALPSLGAIAFTVMQQMWHICCTKLTVDAMTGGVGTGQLITPCGPHKRWSHDDA